jgi:tetratricopeptide (TPR) repeat protein
MMGQASSGCLPYCFSMPRPIFRALISALLVALLCESSATQTKVKPAGDPSASVQQGLKLANEGHCEQAIPLLRKTLAQAADKEIKRQAGFAGVRCAMSENRSDTAVEFLRFLNREFPHDPDVLYVSVHTYSDLSTGAAQELAATAPDSSQARKLNAEAFELQGKWDQAEKEYRRVLEKTPRLPGIHFRMARLLLSKPDPSPTVAQEAKKELQQEIEIDPSNEDAEYVLGELARQDSQWPEAIDHFTRASKLDAGFGDAFLGLGVSLISAKRFSEAILPLETAVKLEPKNPGAHYSLAQAYNRAGRKQDADREFAVHRQMTEKAGAKADSPQGAPPENSN